MSAGSPFFGFISQTTESSPPETPPSSKIHFHFKASVAIRWLVIIARVGDDKSVISGQSNSVIMLQSIKFPNHLFSRPLKSDRLSQLFSTVTNWMNCILVCPLYAVMIVFVKSRQLLEKFFSVVSKNCFSSDKWLSISSAPIAFFFFPSLHGSRGSGLQLRSGDTHLPAASQISTAENMVAETTLLGSAFSLAQRLAASASARPHWVIS